MDERRTSAELYSGLNLSSRSDFRSGILSIPDGLRIRRGEVGSHLTKDAIVFVGAQVLWRDPDRIEIPARSVDEPRTQVIGRIGDLVWSAFVTHRGDRIRIISVRRARDEEEAAYLQD